MGVLVTPLTQAGQYPDIANLLQQVNAAIQQLNDTFSGAATARGTTVGPFVLDNVTVNPSNRGQVNGTTGNFNAGLTVSASGAAITGNSSVTGILSVTGTLQQGGTAGVGGIQGKGNVSSFSGASTYVIDMATDTTRFFSVGHDTATNGGWTWISQRSDNTNQLTALSLSISSNKTIVTGTWPTSSAGLATGTLWSNAGVINVA